MFCPKCGKDCEDSKFCSDCGQSVFHTEGSDIGVTLEPPIGRYEGLDGYIDLSFYTLTIHKKTPRKPAEHTIAYYDIADVDFCPASDEKNGYLAIKEKGESHLQIGNIGNDERILTFDNRMSDAFAHVYDCLVMHKHSERSGKNDVSLSALKQVSVRCPKCLSEKCVVCGKLLDSGRFYGPRVVYTRSPWVMLLSSILEFCRVILSRKKIYECLKCGYSWIAWKRIK